MTTITERAAALLPSGDRQRQIARLMQGLDGHSEDHSAAPRTALAATFRRFIDGEDVDLHAAAEKVLDGLRENQIRGIYGDMIRSEIENLRMNFTATTSAIQPALDYLRGELRTVVADVKTLDRQLGTIATPTGAIHAGVSDKWRALDEAADRYLEIRTAQLDAYESVKANQDTAINSLRRYGLLADALTVTPTLISERRHAARNSPTTYAAELKWVAWLQSESEHTVPDLGADLALPANDRLSYLRDICTHAHPWLPDWDTLSAAGSAGTTASQPTQGNGATAHLWEGLRTYAEITSTEIPALAQVGQNA
ncbi:hypothetical protein [Microbacterium sp. Leaf320]|uniref:hypothetical protein n=1 Tax=Microbacterium sp. Leaf320 TaxID=1736334 RepID=UPI0006FB7309|nr:hypothetical protein [Microbacterium sp. Leaf320]KQQ66106.1 hypothetical protein ASF63_12350 [Microbacterium sp. Leaf320]